MIFSCGVAGAAESVMVASTVTEATPAAVDAAAEQVGEIQYVEYEPRMQIGGHMVASWQDGFYMNSENRTNINQIWLSAERAMDTSNGFDWGFGIDATFGTESAQCYGDGGFDGKWGVSGDGYCASIYQAYTELGYYNMSLKVGKFGTPIGYESYDSTEMLYNTHSYMYEYEPQTHFGALLTWDATDRLSVLFGVTTGADNSLHDDTEDYGLLFGATYQLNECMNISYVGMWNKSYGYSVIAEAYDDTMTFDDRDFKRDEYQQTLAFSWDITDRLNCGAVFNYAGMTPDEDELAYTHYGLGNYLTYVLTDKITLGARYEWFRHCWEEDDADLTCQAISVAAKYMPNEHIFIRPELRYDWQEGEDGEDEGVTGSFGFGLVF